MTTPSTAALITGEWPTFNGVRTHSGHKLNATTETVAQRLRQLGYHTVARVTGPLTTEVGLDRGFDDYQWRRRRDYVYGDWGQRLLDELGSWRSVAPWFLFLHLFELHNPRQIAPSFDKPDFGRNYYERAISSLDPWLGRIVEAAGKDAVVFVTADHGERVFETTARETWHELSRPLRKPIRRLIVRLSRNPVSGAFFEQGHGFHVYDELVRVPLLCRGPMFPSGMTLSQQVRHVDIVPTILDIAGVEEQPQRLNGKSLLPLVTGASQDDRPAYCESFRATAPNPQSLIVAIRTPKLKYCYRPFAPKPFEELYDLSSDPLERKNLAAERPQDCVELRQQLQALSLEFEAEPLFRGQRMSADEEKVLEKRLKDLGYIE